MNTDDKNMTTQDLIKRLKSIMPLEPLTEEIHKAAADRLEELQRERDEARAEVAQLKDTVAAYEAATVNQQLTVRPEPSRLEIAAMIMASAIRSQMTFQDVLKVTDGLIAAAREAK